MKQLSTLLAWLKALSNHFRALTKTKKIIVSGGSLGALLVIILIVSNSGSTKIPPTLQNRTVKVISVQDLAISGSPLELTGRVKSQTEARIRTEKQGAITGVYRTVGERVSAGTIIAEIDNRAERAALLQAEGSFEQAEAQLAKAVSGVRGEQLSILEVNQASALSALNNAESSIVNALLSAYADTEDAIVRKADQTFSNASSNNPIFNISTSDYSLTNNLKQSRVQIAAIIKRQADSERQIIVTDNLHEELLQSLIETRFVLGFLDDLTSALNVALPSAEVSEADIAAYRADAALARSTMSATLSSLLAAKNDLTNKGSALEIAQKNLEQGQTGERSEDILFAEASLKLARGAFRQAEAALEKTYIRTPISGTINTLTVDKGDFVPAFTLAAIISNNNALELETFVSESDKEEIAIGSSALIAGRYEGIVTSIAPGLDPDTRKIQVKVGLVDNNVSLTNGTSVRVSIQRNNLSTPGTLDRVLIPITALKVETDRIVVFTVSEDSILEAHPIVQGPLVGRNIVIREGVNLEMNIVLDARGLNEGDTVEVSI